MQASTINDHTTTDTLSTEYLTLGDRNNLTFELQWAKEENHI
jgi:hypothetical protein